MEKKSLPSQLQLLQWYTKHPFSSCSYKYTSFQGLRSEKNLSFWVWDYVLLSKSCTLWRQGKEFFLTLNFEVKYVRNTVSILFQIFLEDSQSQLGLNWSYLNIFSQSLEVIFPTYSWDGDENKGKVFHHLLLSLTMIPHIP